MTRELVIIMHIYIYVIFFYLQLYVRPSFIMPMMSILLSASMDSLHSNYRNEDINSTKNIHIVTQRCWDWE